MSRRKLGRCVLFFCKYRTHSAFEKLAGISAFERQRGRVVRFVNYSSLTQSVEAYVDAWSPIGIITDTPRFRSRKCPTVFIDMEPSLLKRRDVCVQYDSAEAGRMAAEEFVHEGVTNFAFLGSFEPRYWSDERQTGFVRAVEEGGGSVQVYQGERRLDDILTIQNDLQTWLQSLPKPCGLFAANDFAADYVLGTCQIMGIRVPEDVAVIGVDNDVTICENAFVPISSIEPDFRESGRLAAAALEELISGKRAGSRTFGAARFVRRASSHLIKRSDFAVRKVLEQIRSEACKGLKARDVIRSMRCPRRTAELRFRAATGMSVLEAIDEVRFERALGLLRKKSLPIAEIAAACAFSSETMFRRFFRKRAGVSPREWRNGARG